MGMGTLSQVVPLNITELVRGEAYFAVRIERSGKIYLDNPFRFLETLNKIQVRSCVCKIIRIAQHEGFEKPVCFPEQYAAGIGLLVGTEYPMEFGDNHARTFKYSPDAYAFLREIAQEQDKEAYTQLVGKRVPKTAQQQLQHFLLDTKLASLKTLFIS